MSNLRMQADIFVEQRDKAIKEMQIRKPSASYEDLSEVWTITKLAELQLQINELKYRLNAN